ncbi:hypothetical protein [Actinokineospora sp.]|uniref:hypothetical protein n=1 Tax=Actinokineospora sp. TaxID=1872133 RepID=UPI00403830F9
MHVDGQIAANLDTDARPALTPAGEVKIAAQNGVGVRARALAGLSFDRSGATMFALAFTTISAPNA